MGEHQATGVPARPGPTSARFGEAPLAQTVAAAGAIRRLSSLLLSLEHPHPTVDAILTQISEWEGELTAAVPPDSAPRIGADDDGNRRVYLDHATDIGAFNPCFPEYRFDNLDGEIASGRITFPQSTRARRDWCMVAFSRCSSTVSCSTTTALRDCPARPDHCTSPSGGRRLC
jgi:hypothetical protein